MNARLVCSQILMAIGLIGMLVGALDPLEGSFIILPGVTLVTLGALVQRNSKSRVFLSALGMVAFGVAAMVIFSSWGGLGGKSGHSIWWAVFIVPYPIGWIVGVAEALRTLIMPSRSSMARV